MTGPYFVPVISSNSMHADHKPENLDMWFNRGGLVRALKAMASIPSSISIEGFDLELLPELNEFFVRHKGPGEIISGEYAHILPHFFVHIDPKLMASNFLDGLAMRKHPVTFVSEYSIPSSSILQAMKNETKKQVGIYFVDSATAPYSDFIESTSAMKPLSAYSEYETVNAIQTKHALAMRMRMDLAGMINSKFFGYQRLRDAIGAKKVTVQDVITAIKTALDDAAKRNIPFVFWPMDIESCVIGSRHGPQIYVDLAEALSKSGIPMCGPRYAFEQLSKKEYLDSNDPSILYREMNNKWAGFSNQEVLRTAHAKLVESLRGKHLSSAEMKLLLITLGSDPYVIRKHTNKDVKMITMETDSGDLSWLAENTACHDIMVAGMTHLNNLHKNVKFSRLLEVKLKEKHDVLTHLTLQWARQRGL